MIGGRYAGLLIYGNDSGSVQDQAASAIRSALGSGTDPFRLTRLTREQHGRLREEAASMALGGGRKVVHVREAADSLTGVLEKLSPAPSDILLVLEAGDLAARSKLRVMAERRPDWGAVSCAGASGGEITAEIVAFLAASDVSATRDAVVFLSQELAGDTVTRRSELEKLVLYNAGNAMIDLGTAQLCCSLSTEASIGAAAAAALAGKVDLCDALLGDLGQASTTGAGLLAVLAMQVHRMLKMRLLIDSGMTPENACRELLPPLYPRQAASLLRDVRGWRAPALEAVSRAIRDADRACKRAASPDFIIACRLLMAVANWQSSRP